MWQDIEPREVSDQTAQSAAPHKFLPNPSNLQEEVIARIYLVAYRAVSLCTYTTKRYNQNNEFQESTRRCTRPRKTLRSTVLACAFTICPTLRRGWGSGTTSQPYVRSQTEEKEEAEQQLGTELADVMFTVVCLANAHDIDLDVEFEKALDKLRVRDKDRFKKKD